MPNLDETKYLSNTVNQILVFDTKKSAKVIGHEIKSCVIKGVINERHTITPANIVLSKVEECSFIGANLEYVDIKDTLILNSKIQNTSFDFGAFINSEFEVLTFNNCKFHNVSITGSNFKTVIFLDCDLSNMVIESCKFEDCKFINCKTSNKLFELCLFSNITFEKTNIQIQTIIENFGITHESIINSSIRDKTINEDFSIINKEKLADLDNLTVVERWNADYYLNPNVLLEGTSSLDALFDINNWNKTARIPQTFSNLVALLSEFFQHNYEIGKCSIFNILKLHSFTNSIISEMGDSIRRMPEISGSHMIMSSIVDEYLKCYSGVLSNIQNPTVLLMNGPMEPEYYQRFFYDTLHIEDVNVIKVIKHNSPNEVFISWNEIASIAPIIAIFMASKFNFELRKYISSDSLNINNSGLRIENTPKTEKVFQLSLGFDEKDKHLFGLRIKSIFPGELLLDLGIHVSTKQIGIVRKKIIDLLGGDPKGT